MVGGLELWQRLVGRGLLGDDFRAEFRAEAGAVEGDDFAVNDVGGFVEQPQRPGHIFHGEAVKYGGDDFCRTVPIWSNSEFRNGTPRAKRTTISPGSAWATGRLPQYSPLSLCTRKVIHILLCAGITGKGFGVMPGKRVAKSNRDGAKLNDILPALR